MYSSRVRSVVSLCTSGKSVIVFTLLLLTIENSYAKCTKLNQGHTHPKENIATKKQEDVKLMDVEEQISQENEAKKIEAPKNFNNSQLQDDDDEFAVLQRSLDIWSHYDNPELGDFYGGDIRNHPGNRRTFLSDYKQRWPNGVVPFIVDPILREGGLDGVRAFDSLMSGIIKDLANLLASKHSQMRYLTYMTVLLEFVDDFDKFRARVVDGETDKYHAILNAMKTITLATDSCIQFFPINEELIKNYPDLVYLNITGHPGGCMSDVGRSDQEGGMMNLDPKRCFRVPGHILHELLHSLGQLHEHMRPDREKYITIIWKNIRKGAELNFATTDENTVSSFGFPYDFDSITHYPRTAFSVRPDIATIVPKNTSIVIGQRTHLSAIDAKKLRLSYQCDSSRPPMTFEQMLHGYKPKIQSQLVPGEYQYSKPVDDEYLKSFGDGVPMLTDKDRYHIDTAVINLPGGPDQSEEEISAEVNPYYPITHKPIRQRPSYPRYPKYSEFSNPIHPGLILYYLLKNYYPGLYKRLMVDYYGSRQNLRDDTSNVDSTRRHSGPGCKSSYSRCIKNCKSKLKNRYPPYFQK